MRKKLAGFTLVELLVVMAIIAILTIVTVSQFQTAREKANDVSRKGDLNSISKSLLMYYTDYGVFPPASNVNGGTINLNADSGWGGTLQDETTNPPYVYMKKLPKENKAGWSPYCYKVSADRKKFVLLMEEENKLDGECDRNGDGVANDDKYPCGNPSVKYCYYTVSPNTDYDINGNLL